MQLRTLLAVLLIVTFASFSCAAISGVSQTYHPINTIPSPIIVDNNSGSGSDQNSPELIDVNAPILGTLPSVDKNLILKTGPMVYVSGDSIAVINSDKRELAGTIKTSDMVTNGSVAGSAVSVDGKYVYVAINYQVYVDYGGYYDNYSKIVRVDASTQTIIDWFDTAGGTALRYIKTAPDGRVYVSYTTTGGESYAGLYILNFNTKEKWTLDLKPRSLLINDIAFSDDGKQVYMNAWGNYPYVIKLDWTTNSTYWYQPDSDNANYDGYVRTLAMGDAELYLNLHHNQSLTVMNLAYGTFQKLDLTYTPYLFKTSPDKKVLYVLGYITNSNNDEVYFIHKYSGLKYLNWPSYTTTDQESFFAYDAMNYVTPPAGVYPSNMEISPDGRWAYITTAKGGPYGESGGADVIVYDLQYMNQVKTIPVKNCGWSISMAKDPILYSPALLTDFKKIFPVGTFDLITKFDVKKLYPDKNSYAPFFTDDMFVIDAIFTKPLDKTSFSASTFTVKEVGGAAVPGKITIANNIAIFSPDTKLSAGKDYVVFISKSAKSTTNDQLDKDVNWTFNTKVPVLSKNTLNLTLQKSSFLKINTWGQIGDTNSGDNNSNDQNSGVDNSQGNGPTPGTPGIGNNSLPSLDNNAGVQNGGTPSDTNTNQNGGNNGSQDNNLLKNGLNINSEIKGNGLDTNTDTNSNGTGSAQGFNIFQAIIDWFFSLFK